MRMPYCTRGGLYLKYYKNSVKYNMPGNFAHDESGGTSNRILFPRQSPVAIARPGGQLPGPACAAAESRMGF
jgi:hypothetical protein